MVRFLATTLLTLLGNALGLLLAAALFEGFTISVDGFLWSLGFFTLAQVILAPFVLKMAIDYLPALRGGIALVTIFLVLFLTTLVTSSLTVTGVVTWVLAPLVIWLATVIAGVILPLFIFKKTLAKKQARRESN